MRWTPGRQPRRAARRTRPGTCPGAVFVDLDTDSPGRRARAGGTRCPAPAALQAVLRRRRGATATPRSWPTTTGPARSRRGPGGCCAGRACRTGSRAGRRFCAWLGRGLQVAAVPGRRPAPGDGRRSRPRSGCRSSTTTRPRRRGPRRRAARRAAPRPLPRRGRAARPGGRPHPRRPQLPAAEQLGPDGRWLPGAPSWPRAFAAAGVRDRVTGRGGCLLRIGGHRSLARAGPRPPGRPAVGPLALFPGSYSQWCADPAGPSRSAAEPWRFAPGPARGGSRLGSRHERRARRWCGTRILGYDLGGNHPLHPLRLDLTMRLATRARRAGRGRAARAAPPGPRRRAAAGSTRRRTCRPSGGAVPAGRRRRARARHAGQPDLRRHARGAALIAGGSMRRGAGRSREGRADRAVNFAGGLHHAMPRPRLGLLRLQRRRAGDRLAARPGLRPGRLRRRRRPPRRRGAGGVLRRPAGADGLDAPAPADAVPRAPGGRRVRRGDAAGHGGQRRAAAGHRAMPAGCGPSTPSCRGCCAAFRPEVLVTQDGADTHGRTRSPTCTSRRRAAHLYLALRDLAERTSPAAAGSRSAAAGTRCSGWCRGRGPTCWPSCSTATSTRRPRCPRTGSRHAAAPHRATAMPIDMSDGDGRRGHEPWAGGQR